MGAWLDWPSLTIASQVENVRPETGITTAATAKCCKREKVTGWKSFGEADGRGQAVQSDGGNDARPRTSPDCGYGRNS